jgi:hypothetical protein
VEAENVALECLDRLQLQPDLGADPPRSTPELRQDDAEKAKAEAELLRKMQGICRGC